MSPALCASWRAPLRREAIVHRAADHVIVEAAVCHGRGAAGERVGIGRPLERREEILEPAAPALIERIVDAGAEVEEARGFGINERAAVGDEVIDVDEFPAESMSIETEYGCRFVLRTAAPA